MLVAFHENDGNHETNEDNSGSDKQKIECWISGNHGNHGNDKNHRDPGCNAGMQEGHQWARGMGEAYLKNLTGK